MNITQMTLVNFLNDAHSGQNFPATPLDFAPYLAALALPVGAVVCIMGQGYKVHEVNGAPGNTLLLFNDDVVGFYYTDLIKIHDDHLGKKLSVPLILQAVPHRPPPLPRTLSAEGRAALTKAWYVANGHAPDPWPCLGTPGTGTSGTGIPPSSESQPE